MLGMRRVSFIPSPKVRGLEPFQRDVGGAFLISFG